MVEAKCAKCGRIIYRVSFYNYVYKDDNKFYCSWTCYNHRNDGAANHHKHHKVDQYAEDGKTLIKTHYSAIKAAEDINGTADHIRRACRFLTLYKGFIWRYKNDLS